MSRQSNMIPKQSQPPYMAEGAFINPACDLRLPTASLVPNNTPPDSSLLSAYSALTSSPDTFFPRPSHCIPKPSRHGYLTAFSNTGVNMSGARPLAAMKPGVETEPWKMPIHGPTATFPANTLLESGQRYSRLPPDNVARKVPRKASDVRAVVKQTTKRDIDSLLSSSPPKAYVGRQRGFAHLKYNNAAEHAIARRRRVTKAGLDEEDDPKCAARNDQVTKDEGGSRLGPVRPTIKRNAAYHGAFRHYQTRTDSALQTTEPATSPLPRSNLVVPEVLKGIQKALGTDNWNEYLVLLEKLWREEIHGKEFAAATKAIFLAYDDRMRKRINDLMFMEMIKPGLEAERAERGEI